MNRALKKVESPQDWQAYHAIRRKVLWENRGKTDYSDTHPDEYAPANCPLIFTLDALPVGTARLDNFNNGTGAVRLVAILDDYQRMGHGRLMVSMVEEYAKKLGIETLYVNAAPEALGYYEALGWEFFVWDAAELMGIAQDCQQMRKSIV